MTVDLHGVSLLYGRTAAVHDISLSVRKGEFMALVGPSGAGKTTLLRIMAGLERGYRGHVSISGRDVTAVPARDRNIGFMFQSYALFRHMSVFENVAFGLRVRSPRRRPASAEIAHRVRQLLALVQVPELERRYPAQLSGGQRQRVALARALAIEPDVLLLDEPFGALDPLVRKEIRTWLRGLHDRLGLTSIFVTHDQGEAIELADRVAVLRDGRLQQVASAAALEDDPASSFVYAFLGDTIRFEGRVANGAVHLADVPHLRLQAQVRPGPALLLIRPYNVRLVPGETGARVVSAQRRAAYVHYGIAFGARTIEVLAPASMPQLPVGQSCTLDLGAARQFGLDGAADSDLEAAPVATPAPREPELIPA